MKPPHLVFLYRCNFCSTDFFLPSSLLAASSARDFRTSFPCPHNLFSCPGITSPTSSHSHLLINIIISSTPFHQTSACTFNTLIFYQPSQCPAQSKSPWPPRTRTHRESSKTPSSRLATAILSMYLSRSCCRGWQTRPDSRKGSSGLVLIPTSASSLATTGSQATAPSCPPDLSGSKRSSRSLVR